ARRLGHLPVHVPDHRAGAGRRDRAGAGGVRPGVAADARVRQPCGDRPVRGGAGRRAERAAGHRAARPLDRRRTARRRHRRGARLARVPGRGAAGAGRVGRPGDGTDGHGTDGGRVRAGGGGVRGDGGRRAHGDLGRTSDRGRGRARARRRGSTADRGDGGVAVTDAGRREGTAVTTLVEGIGLLYTGDPEREEIEGAALVMEGEKVVWAGEAGRAPAADRRVDAGGRCVIPGFVDSHAHLVFGGDRTAEFEARMSGEPYTGGGIRTTVAATRAASDAELAARAAALVAEMYRQGTTTVEIKSGYGLTVEDERRSLEIAATLTEETTFLGAHVVPAGADPDAYVSLVAGEMLRACAPHARWVDVFCERGAFDGDQTREILTAGMK